MRPIRSFSLVAKALYVLCSCFLLVLSLNLAPAVGQILPDEGSIIYVDIDALGNNDGSSWENAYTDLQSALDAALVGDAVWVAAGTYLPTAEHCGSGDRYKSFQLKNGVAVYGGFDPSTGDIGWQDRDIVADIAYLSGDIGIPGDATDNSYHVFCHPEGLNLDSTAILDGFFIQDGFANGNPPDNAGGGMFNSSASPTLTNITFTDNWAYPLGGGMYNNNSSPDLSFIRFYQNHSTESGGGIHNLASSPMLYNVTFERNDAWKFGGGMSNNSSSPKLTNVIFYNNNSGAGGGLFNTNSSPVLVQCTFSENTAGTGGGMYNDFSSPTLSYILFDMNSVGFCGGGMENSYSSPELTNVIFTSNTSNSSGGAMCNHYSSPEIKIVSFTDNSAGYIGGGMYNYNSSPTLFGAIFTSNHAASSGGGMGNLDASSPLLINVTFSKNSAGSGGGMINDSSTPTLTNITFNGNAAFTDGGGMYNAVSSPILTNVTFSSNSALEHGGGISNEFNSSPTLTNVTIFDNTGDGVYNIDSTSILVNSIVWENLPIQIRGDPATVTYSDIQDGYSGEGNISADPLLGILADNGGYVLTHPLGAGSPAIDSGNPDPAICSQVDARFEPRPVDGDGDGISRCDMGAYEFQLIPLVHSFLPLIVK